MIEADRARISLSQTPQCKFRVSAVKAGNVRVVAQRSIQGLKIAVTLRAARILGFGQPPPAPMLHMTGAACRGKGLARSVDRSSVAGEAAVIRNACTVTLTFHVAQGTLVPKNSVRCRHGAGAIQVRAAEYAFSENPAHRDEWKGNRKNQPPAAEGTQPRE